MRGPLVGLTVVAALGLGFVAGRAPWGSGVTSAAPAAASGLVRAQFGAGPAENDPRELIPLTPGPGDAPGQGGQPGPGQNPQGSQAPGEGQCTVLLFRDGRFYQMQPGAPGPGAEGQGGQPGGGDELFPLEPGRPTPTPAPSTPTPGAPAPTLPDLRV